MRKPDTSSLLLFSSSREICIACPGVYPDTGARTIIWNGLDGQQKKKQNGLNVTDSSSKIGL